MLWNGMKIQITLNASLFEIPFKKRLVVLIDFHISLILESLLNQSLLLLFLLISHLDLFSPSFEAFRPTILEIIVKEPVTPLVERSELVSRRRGTVIRTSSAVVFRLLPSRLGLITRVVGFTLVL
jgi:hypothetical protein